jgi:hypothetical protein
MLTPDKLRTTKVIVFPRWIFAPGPWGHSSDSEPCHFYIVPPIQPALATYDGLNG